MECASRHRVLQDEWDLGAGVHCSQALKGRLQDLQALKGDVDDEVSALGRQARRRPRTYYPVKTPANACETILRNENGGRGGRAFGAWGGHVLCAGGRVAAARLAHS